MPRIRSLTVVSVGIVSNKSNDGPAECYVSTGGSMVSGDGIVSGAEGKNLC